jgi:anti-sigma B factor antagonist
MFNITINENREICLAGRFDAAQVEKADAVLATILETTRVNFRELEYISSAGLGILLKTQKRMKADGQSLILTHMNKMVRDVFRMARFDVVFRIEEDQ